MFFGLSCYTIFVKAFEIIDNKATFPTKVNSQHSVNISIPHNFITFSDYTKKISKKKFVSRGEIPMRLLLAEDEKALSRALVMILQKSGFEVDPVYDGESALDFIESGNYDAAVLDIMMPKKSGLEVLKVVREKENLLPILLLTAKAEINDKVTGLELGANDYLTKPFAAKELIARIRAMLRMQTAYTDSVLHMKNISLNRATFELLSTTGSFRLSNREFQMMEMFLCNQGHVISEQRFMEKIWADEGNEQGSVVWLYISYLKKKLQALHAEIEIKEKGNAGYSLEVA